MSGDAAGGIAAWIDAEPLPVAAVDDRLARLRSGAFGSRLPGLHTAEGRNARRWLVQLICAQRLVRAEIARHGIAAEPAPPLSIEAALALGGVAAAVLASVPGARRLADLLAGDPGVDEGQVRAYYRRNLDLYDGGAIGFGSVRAAIREELVSAARDRWFASWLEQQMSVRVRLADGFEHPAHPGHPDATHRH